MCKEGFKDKDCIKECGKDRFDCIYFQDFQIIKLKENNKK